MRAIEWFGTAIVALCVLAFGLIFLDVFFFGAGGNFAILGGATILGLPFIALAGALIAYVARLDVESPIAEFHELNLQGILISSAPRPNGFSKAMFWIGMSGVLLGVLVFLLLFSYDVQAGDLDLAMYDLGLAAAPTDFNSGTEPSASLFGFWGLLFFGLPGALLTAIGQMLRRRA